VRVAVLLPDAATPAPVIVSSYGGPHAQRVVRAPLAFATEQWLADQGFAVVIIDGRGSPGVSPSSEAAIHRDLAGPPLADQVTGLRLAEQAFPGRLDTARVGIRGWSFGGYLAALAVLSRPDVFHAAFAGAPVTQWRLYDTHYTERYLGLPEQHGPDYDASSLLGLAGGLRRPLCLVHGMADDNVVAAHTLQLSAALTAAGRPHEVLPLPGVSHMTPGESITENLLRIESAFFRRHLSAGEPAQRP
jgi:dipeptidyl-peptidase-4